MGFSYRLRAWLFAFLIYAAMAVIGIAGAIPAAISRKWAYKMCRFYALFILGAARILCGLRYEIRGEVPRGSVVIASKHQSFFDILIHFATLNQPNFVMKKELRYVPIFGFYASRLGVSLVKRGEKGKSMRQMLSGVQKNKDATTQLVIYPQGTRVAPRVAMPYKIGAAVLAQNLGRVIVPVATNVGCFCNKHGGCLRGGLAVMEYLPVIETDCTPAVLIKRIETVVEDASNRLMEEAGI